MTQVAFSELWARSYFSFLEGASAPEAMVARATELGMTTLGLVDRGGLYGAVRLVQAAERYGLAAMVGAELNLDGGGRLVLWATDRPSYQQLCRAVSQAQLAGAKGAHQLHLAGLTADLAAAAGGVGGGRDAALPPALERRRVRKVSAGAATESRVDPAQLGHCTVMMGGPHSPISLALLRGDREAADRAALALRAAFPSGQVYLALLHHLHPGDSWLAAETAACAERTQMGLMVSGSPRYATASEAALLDVLAAIRHNCSLEAAAERGLLLPNHQYWMRDGESLRELLPYPQAFQATAELAARAELQLDFRHSRFPAFTAPRGLSPDQYLEQLCRLGIPDRYPTPGSEVESRLLHELRVIAKCKLAEFFLIVWELMDFARREGIPAQGRGSAADSLVAYLLGITRVDPIAHHLLFERFLHEEMQGTPDIDIDISSAHRERLLRHVYDTYGQDRTGMVCTVITFQARMALRQVGTAFGLPSLVVEKLSRSVDRWYGKGEQALVSQVLESGGAHSAQVLTSQPWRQFANLVEAVVGVPRHLSIHVGGMLVTGEPLWDIAPLERATMPGRVVVQFDKNDVEDLGLIKIDLLGLRTLSAVAETLQELEDATGERPDLEALDLADPEVYAMCAKADTIGVFQIESRAQQQTLPRSNPKEFNDLVVEVALIRPGPIQGKAVHPYLRRRQGREPVTYLHPLLEPILRDTMGVILYQEQILEIAMQLAGFSAGEADRFRRAMNRHRSRVEMTSLEQGFMEGCARHEVSAAVAAELFEAVRGFAEFGFCRSHAAAFARTAYETAWLRLYHHPAYLVGLLNHQPMGFYHPSVLVEDAKRRGVTVLSVDVNLSRGRCHLEELRSGPAGSRQFGVRLGFNYVKELGENLRERLDQERERGPYRSPEEFWRRTELPRPALDSLVLVGALDSFGESRRKLLWRLKAVEEALTGSRPFRPTAAASKGALGSPPSGPRQGLLLELPAEPPQLADLTAMERAAADYRIMGLTTGAHLVSFLRPQLTELGAIPLAEARESPRGSRVLTAGLVITRQAPHSAHGMRFFTVVDETAQLDLVLRPEVYRAHRTWANHDPVLGAEGVLQVADGAKSLLVERLVRLPRAARPAAEASSADSLFPAPSSHDYH
ncbi:MAG TPA: error-prone DNA polymerase [Candidatus Acidoferrales bacterium]|nr:error-prone DNA polymerase [Candidatus Acidoferrales bacterium]